MIPLSRFNRKRSFYILTLASRMKINVNVCETPTASLRLSDDFSHITRKTCFDSGLCMSFTTRSFEIHSCSLDVGQQVVTKCGAAGAHKMCGRRCSGDTGQQVFTVTEPMTLPLLCLASSLF